AIFLVIVLASLLALAIAAIMVLLGRGQAFRARASFEETRRASLALETWKQTELARLHEQDLDLARSEMNVQLEQWKLDWERKNRREAVQKSQDVTLGKVAEHFVPYLPEFPYDPRDARFLGSPIDFLVFDGLSGGAVRSIVFVEVKTGRSSLNGRERR